MSKFKNGIEVKLLLVDKDGKEDDFGRRYSFDTAPKGATLSSIIELIGNIVVNSKKLIAKTAKEAGLKWDIPYGEDTPVSFKAEGDPSIVVQVIVCKHCSTSSAVYSCWSDEHGDHMMPQTDDGKMFCPNCGKRLSDETITGDKK